MTHTISPCRHKLTITVTPAEQAELCELGETIHQDATMADFLEPLTCNSELEWIPEGVTGDLTSAPMLGIMGEEMTAQAINRTVPIHYGMIQTGSNGRKAMFQPILERWAFADYQVRSVLQDLRDKGEAIFVDRF